MQAAAEQKITDLVQQQTSMGRQVTELREELKRSQDMLKSGEQRSNDMLSGLRENNTRLQQDLAMAFRQKKQQVF